MHEEVFTLYNIVIYETKLVQLLCHTICCHSQIQDYISLTISLLIIGTASHHDLDNTKHEKDRHIAQLNRKLQSVTREKEESEEIVTTLQTKLQQYKQQLLKTTGCKCNNSIYFIYYTLYQIRCFQLSSQVGSCSRNSTRGLGTTWSTA